ncbi:MAG: hypothetical protein ABIC95_07375 [archaeon]
MEIEQFFLFNDVIKKYFILLFLFDVFIPSMMMLKLHSDLKQKLIGFMKKLVWMD